MKLIKRNKSARDCGIVAAFNAASWSNKYLPYEQVEKMARSCGYSPKKGIYGFQFVRLLSKLKVPAKKATFKSLEEMESKLYLGSMIVVLYTCTGTDTGHAIVLFTDHKGRIKLVNPEPQKDIVTWDDLAADLNANGMKNFCVYEIPRRRLISTVATRNDAARSG